MDSFDFLEIIKISDSPLLKLEGPSCLIGGSLAALRLDLPGLVVVEIGQPLLHDFFRPNIMTYLTTIYLLSSPTTKGSEWSDLYLFRAKPRFILCCIFIEPRKHVIARPL